MHIDTNHQHPNASNNRSNPANIDEDNGDLSNIDGDFLSAIVDCFSYLIMLTKITSEDEVYSSSLRQPRRASSGKSSAGFGRREILCVALKEGRIFMEQFIRTSKVPRTRCL